MTHIGNTEMRACLFFSFDSISPPKLHTSKFTLCSTPQPHPLSTFFQKEIICKSKLKWKKVKVRVTRWCPTLCIYSPGQSTGVGSFPTQRLNLGLSHCWQIPYQLSHKGSPKILYWVAYPFSRGSSWPRNPTGVSCIAGRFFSNWAIREAHFICKERC